MQVRGHKNCSVGMAMALVACSIGAGCRQAGNATTCITELAAPAYPAIAASARLTARGMEALVRLESGQVRDVTHVSPGDAGRADVLFWPEIEKALRRSRFDASCGDRTVTIVFDFVYADPAFRDPPAQERVSFIPPNRIVVATTGRVIDISQPEK